MYNLDTSRKYGICKWFHQHKGYGFIIECADKSDSIHDVFCHISQFKPEIVPQSGQIIEYYLNKTSNGLKAFDCVIIKNISLVNNSYIAYLLKNLSEMGSQEYGQDTPGLIQTA